MTAGMGRGGFFAGAIGGLALALLLVGVASFVPQTNPAIRAASTSSLNVAEGVVSTAASAAFSSATPPVASASATSTATIASTTTAVTTSASPPSAAGAKTATVTATVTGPSSTKPIADQGGLTVASTTTTVAGAATGSVTSQTQGNGPSPAASSLAQKPSSLLAVLPGEGVGALLATLSPLLIGLLVAVLIYGAYTRRQDSSP